MSGSSPRRTAARLARPVPALLALALLAIAVTPRSRAVLAREASAFALWNPICAIVLQQADSVATFGLAPGWSAYQPLAATGNISQVVQRVSGIVPGPTYSGQFTLLPWDAATQAPAPANVMLRSGGFYFSYAGDVQTVALPLAMPLVLLNGPLVADPMGHGIAMRLSNRGYNTTLPLDMDTDGDPAVPAMQLQNGIDPLGPAPGAHPVDAAVFCGGDAGLQSLRIVQAVTTTDAQDFSTAKLFLQRFRVPAPCELRWIEIAFVLGNGFPGGGGYGGGGSGRQPSIAILDLQGITDPPPAGLPTPLVQANLFGVSEPSWQTHAEFSQVIALQPGHDYGLLVDTGGTFVPGMRALTGHEGIDFTSRIFRLSERDTTAEEWRTREARALSFRMIGVPVAALDAPGASAASSLHLSAQPNPARGAVSLAIAGARGPLDLDVLDARGRRVAGGRSGGDRWLWPGTDAAGRPLPAGVYFIRARGNDGVAVSERVVLVR